MPTTSNTSIRFTAADRDLLERVKTIHGTNNLKDTVLYALRLAAGNVYNPRKEEECSTRSS